MAQTSFSHILRIMVVKDSIEWLGNLRSINNHNDHSLESHLPRCLINPDQGQILRQELKCKFFFQHSQFWNIQYISNIWAFAFCALLRCHLYFFVNSLWECDTGRYLVNYGDHVNIQWQGNNRDLAPGSQAGGGLGGILHHLSGTLLTKYKSQPVSQDFLFTRKFVM